jgi:hypothetical protein
VNQWIWNLRLHLGQHVAPSALCWTELAPAPEAVPTAPVAPEAAVVPQTAQYGPPRWAHRSFTKGFAGTDFVPQPDGTLLCPAGHPLSVHERRPERNGSLRIVYGARVVHCRSCPLREHCLESPTTKKPRQVSAVLWPRQANRSDLAPPSPPSPASSGRSEASSRLSALVPPQAPHPVLWADWPRASFRRQWLHTLRTQTVELTGGAGAPPEDGSVSQASPVQTRAQRAHYRLSWLQRLARNARSASAPPLSITIYGLPPSLAEAVGCGFLTAA